MPELFEFGSCHVPAFLVRDALAGVRAHQEGVKVVDPLCGLTHAFRTYGASTDAALTLKALSASG
jgi:hypothetical protein